MRLVRPALVTVLSTAVVAAVLAAPPASARADSPRDARRDGDHFPVSIDTTVPAGGSSLVTTPTLGRDTQVVKVTVKPQPGVSDQDAEVFKEMTHVLGSYKKKGEKLLMCVMLHQLVLSGFDESEDAQFEEENAVPALLVLAACLEVAGLLAARAAERAGRDDDRARACDKAGQSVPATLEKTDDGYRLTVDGTTEKTKKRMLRVGCRVKGAKVIYKVRAAKKGVPVRRAVGKKLSIGVQSPNDASSSVPVRVTFATP